MLSGWILVSTVVQYSDDQQRDKQCSSLHWPVYSKPKVNTSLPLTWVAEIVTTGVGFVEAVTPPCMKLQTELLVESSSHEVMLII